MALLGAATTATTEPSTDPVIEITTDTDTDGDSNSDGDSDAEQPELFPGLDSEEVTLDELGMVIQPTNYMNEVVSEAQLIEAFQGKDHLSIFYFYADDCVSCKV